MPKELDVEKIIKRVQSDSEKRIGNIVIDSEKRLKEISKNQIEKMIRKIDKKHFVELDTRVRRLERSK